MYKKTKNIPPCTRCGRNYPSLPPKKGFDGYPVCQPSVCDACIAKEFGLENLDQRYDSEDELGMTALLERDAVVSMLGQYLQFKSTFRACSNYEELRDGLADLPMTWYPNLIQAMVQAAYKKDVFKKGKASEFIKYFEKAMDRNKK